tara:strand:- start:2611 stop:2826 length:216 start_codon:yes stop_codon:yes gene_type:complete
VRYVVKQCRVEQVICTDYIEVEADSPEEAQRMVEDNEVEIDYADATMSDAETVDVHVDEVTAKVDCQGQRG